MSFKHFLWYVLHHPPYGQKIFFLLLIFVFLYRFLIDALISFYMFSIVILMLPFLIYWDYQCPAVNCNMSTDEFVSKVMGAKHLYEAQNGVRMNEAKFDRLIVQPELAKRCKLCFNL